VSDYIVLQLFELSRRLRFFQRGRLEITFHLFVFAQ